MLFTVFSIYDSAIKTWLPPLYARNNGEMIRNFSDAIQDPQSKLAKHPQDYVLFELGSFDDDKCVFSLHKAPVRLCMAMDFVKPENRGAGGTGSPSVGLSSGGTSEIQAK